MGFWTDVGTSFQIIGAFIWFNLFIFIIFAMMFGVLAWLWYDWLLWNMRVRVIHPTGIEVIRRARLKFDKKTKEKKMIVQFEHQHDGQAPDEKLYYAFKKGWLMTFTGVTAIKDNFGNLHWVSRTLSTYEKEKYKDPISGLEKERFVSKEGVENLTIVNQNKIDQFLTSIARAARKWRLTPEKMLQWMMIIMVIFALITFGGLGFGLYEIKKIHDDNLQFSTQQNAVASRMVDLTQTLGETLLLYGFNNTRSNNVSATTPPPDTTTIITPFTNVVHG